MKRDIYSIRKMIVMCVVLSIFLLAPCLLVGVKGQQIIVEPDSYWQEFLGTGASCGLYLGHYLSMTEEDQLKASQMLYQYLELNHVKYYHGETPSENPALYDKVVKFINNARTYNSKIKVIINANNLPGHLELPDGQGIDHGEHDGSIPGIMDSIANYYFQICKGYYDRGIKVDILELTNERGNTSKVADLYDVATDKFRAMINNSSINRTHVPMPLIAGPAPWSAASAKGIIEYWKQNRPNAWRNVDIVTTHGYQNGAEEFYKATVDVADGKTFYQSEQTAKLQRDEKPGIDVIAEQFKDSGPPKYVYNTEIARHMIQFFNAGGNAFFHFLTNNPGGTNPALLGIAWKGSPVRGDDYFGFKHLAATHPIGSRKVDSDLTDMGNYEVVAFRVPGKNEVYVHIANLYNTSGQVKIKFASNSILASQGWITDASSEFYKFRDITYSSPINSITISTTPYSVITLKVAIKSKDGSTRIAGMDDELNDGGQIMIYPMPVMDKVTIKSEEEGVTRLSIYDMFGRTVYQNEFVGEISLSTAGLASSNVYNVVLSNFNKTVTKRIVVKK